MSREAQLTDAMIDLLIETVHKIGTRSKRKVVGDIAKDIERVYGKERLLVEIASARSMNHRGASAMSFSRSPVRPSWRRSSRRAMRRALWTGASTR
jgi:hypothetical protein